MKITPLLPSTTQSPSSNLTDLPDGCLSMVIDHLEPPAIKQFASATRRMSGLCQPVREHFVKQRVANGAPGPAARQALADMYDAGTVKTLSAALVSEDLWDANIQDWGADLVRNKVPYARSIVLLIGMAKQEGADPLYLRGLATTFGPEEVPEFIACGFSQRVRWSPDSLLRPENERHL